MCRISVVPMPSRISTPKRSRQRLKSSSGSASPADTHRRSDERSKRSLGLLHRQHRRVEGGDPEEERRPVAREDLEHGLRASAGADRARSGRPRPSGSSRRCPGRRRRRAWPPSRPCRSAGCRAPAWRRSPGRPPCRGAGARRPWGSRSSPTSRARTPRRRARSRRPPAATRPAPRGPRTEVGPAGPPATSTCRRYGACPAPARPRPAGAPRRRPPGAAVVQEVEVVGGACSVLTGIGTAPILMAPQNARGTPARRGSSTAPGPPSRRPGRAARCRCGSPARGRRRR